MKRSKSIFLKWHEIQKSIHFDGDLYELIVADMQAQEPIYTPGKQWRMQTLFGHQKEKRKRPSFDDMLSPWVGPQGSQKVTEAAFNAYSSFMSTNDHLGLFAGCYPDGKFDENSGFRLSDLGTIMDLSLIAAHYDFDEDKRVNVLEVGGGHGRLAIALLSMLTQNATYFLVDAVPATLMYAYLFMKKALPERSVGLYCIDQERDPYEFDCFITSSWHFDSIQRYRFFDICLNIASMQEMENDQADYYIKLFDEVIKQDGYLFLSNSRDYIKPREFIYPLTWKLLNILNTPRSFTPYYPFEVFGKGHLDYTHENAILSNQYFSEVITAYQNNIAILQAAIKTSKPRVKRVSPFLFFKRLVKRILRK